jgi:hypothetical protein
MLFDSFLAQASPALPSTLRVVVDNTGEGIPWTTFIPVLAAVGALIGVILNILSTARLQRKTRKLDRENEIRVARSVVFAQLSRVYRTIHGEYDYLADSDIGWIWIALYATLLPSQDNLRRIQVLTAEEVLDITAFLYSYHERMGYIAALTGGRDKTSVKFDCELVGVDYREPTRELLWLLQSLVVLERKALAAMDAIVNAAKGDYGENDALFCRLHAEQKRSGDIAVKAQVHKNKLKQKTGVDFDAPKSAEGISEGS